jgi:opacity protein-like surface antigen
VSTSAWRANLAASITASAFNTNGDDALSISSQLRAIGTIRARTGVVFDNVLLYVTGGLAYANFERNVTGHDIDGERIDVFESSRTRWGWVAGFGAEWAIGGQLEHQARGAVRPHRERRTDFRLRC